MTAEVLAMSIWSDRGGWSPEEEALLYSRFGEEVTLDIIERSPLDPTVVLTWVAWDFQHPEIYVIDFKERTKYDTIGGEDVPTVAAARASEKWGKYFPAPSAEGTSEG
jgi:hypothetical protein